MDAVEFAARFRARINGMHLKTWETKKPELIEELMKRDDMPAIFQEFPDKRSIVECRCRVLLRRAFRKRFGPNADVAHAETTTHSNFGLF